MLEPDTEPRSVDTLSEAKRNLLASLLLARGRERAAARSIPRRDPAQPSPLSRGQEQLWVASSLAGSRPLYNVPYGVRLSGALEVPALLAALEGIVARHAILRTVYRQRDDGGLEQVVMAAEPFVLPVEDAESEESAFAAAHREAAAPIDLESGPVLRGRLLRITADDHLLVLVVHHIATDAWSVGVLLAELAELYDAARTGREPRVPVLDIDYADAAAHQRSQEPDDHGAAIDQWRTRLAGTQPLALASADRGAAQTGSRIRRTWGDGLGRTLRDVAEAQHTTVFNVMLTAFAVLLHRYTGTSRFAIGTVMANRDRQTEPLIGYFANTVPIVADVQAADTLAEVLAKTTSESLWAREHQLHFDVLVEGLRPRRILAESPLFEAMFVFNNAPGHELRLPGLALTAAHLHSSTAKFPLDLSCAVSDDEVMVSLEFDHSAYDTAAAERLLDHYQQLVAGLCRTPAERADTVAMLTPAEHDLVIGRWNRTAQQYPDTATAHGLFEQWADRQPAAVAVVCGTESIGYGELDARANQLAHLLLAHGCGRHDRVGIRLERGVDLVVAQLAVAKCGAGYVPLDPAHPAERLRWMLEDSGARFVIGQGADGTGGDGDDGDGDGNGDGNGDGAGDAEPIVIHTGVAAGFPTSRPECETRPDDLLYLIYTSGSTGRPKGVLLDHRGRVNNFSDFNRRFGVGPGERVFGVSALAFDMSAYDVFGTLMAGATLVFPEPRGERSPDHWIDVIEAEGVTVWHSVPALFGLLVEETEARASARLPLRLVLLGGDWIPLALPERARGHLREGARLVSMGGATEVSMDSTIHLIDRVDPARHSIPYGAPMANQTAYVLDASLSPLPVGAAGELYLGGAGVGWGYHNQPRLSAERFLPDPFSAVPGARMYRTGDRARWMPDGDLELLGRIDFQVKVNGYRVETGEIEAALSDLLDGRPCLVVARGEAGASKTLVAYLPAADGADGTDGTDDSGDSGESDDEQLRRALSARLPQYMVPSHFVRLDSFPLTGNGKIDRRALPAPTIQTPVGRAPRTDTERALATLWREVLAVAEHDGLPVDTSFFALGGSSIAVIRMVSAARRAGLPLTPRMVFAAQTIESLARALDEADAEADADAFAAPTAQTPPQDAGPTVTPSQRHMLRMLEQAWVPGLYQMQSTTRLPIPVDREAFSSAWRQLSLRHAALRTVFHRRADGTWSPEVADELEPAVGHLDWRDRPADRIADDLIALLEEERSGRVDVSAAPLWRVWLVQGPDSWWMGQVQSYLVADGWSNLVLLDELLEFYLAALEGRQSALPPVCEFGGPVAGSVLEADAAYWRRQLAGAHATRLAAAPGRLGPSRFARVGSRMDASLAAALRARAAEHGHTFSTWVCAGWTLLAAARLGRTDVTVGVVSAGRDRAGEGVERAVGLFIAALPVRVEVDWAEPLEPLLDRLQLTRAEGAEHTAVDTGELQGLGADESPLFDSVIVMANYPVSPALRAQQSSSAPAAADRDGTRNQTEFSLRLDITDDAEPRVVLSYYADRIADGDAARLLDDYLATLEAMAHIPGATAGQVTAFRTSETGVSR
ncbi:amino acid adenylation domain-containing protein [Catenulispora sp. GP43]|uniref:non-ribosomal peptide synthetase n=1 Tax=Catenulispora sp. GP43 TaxID=3156263 RepID=UPI0035117B86